MLRNKFAVVTGSNRGIGKSIIEKFASNGANLFACSRKQDKTFSKFLNNLSEKNNIKIKEFFFDLSDDAAVKKNAEELTRVLPF